MGKSSFIFKISWITKSLGTFLYLLSMHTDCEINIMCSFPRASFTFQCIVKETLLKAWLQHFTTIFYIMKIVKCSACLLNFSRSATELNKFRLCCGYVIIFLLKKFFLIFSLCITCEIYIWKCHLLNNTRFFFFR